MKKIILKPSFLPVVALFANFPALSFELIQTVPPVEYNRSYPMNYEPNQDRYRRLNGSLEMGGGANSSGCASGQGAPTSGQSLQCGDSPPSCLTWELSLANDHGTVLARSPNNAATSVLTPVVRENVYITAVITSQCESNHIVYFLSSQTAFATPTILVGSTLAHSPVALNVPAGVSCTLSGPDTLDLGDFSVEQIQAGITSDRVIALSGQCNFVQLQPIVTLKGTTLDDGSFQLGSDVSMLLRNQSGGSIFNGIAFPVKGNVNLNAHLSPASPNVRVKGGDKTATLQVILSLP